MEHLGYADSLNRRLGDRLKSDVEDMEREIRAAAAETIAYYEQKRGNSSVFFAHLAFRSEEQRIERHRLLSPLALLESTSMERRKMNCPRQTGLTGEEACRESGPTSRMQAPTWALSDS